MNRSAFTMLELVFVIVVIAILGVLALPSFDKNELELAAEQIANDIRYTQHLAMKSDKFNPSVSDWYKERWQIRFQQITIGSKPYIGYTIYSDVNSKGNINNGEAARDSVTGTAIQAFNSGSLIEGSPSNLTKKYKISNIVVDCSTTNDGASVGTFKGVLAFDNLGRPYSGITNASSATQYLLKNSCDINLTNPQGSLTLRVHPETGYVCTINPLTEECVATN